MSAASIHGLLSVAMPAYNEEANIEATVLEHVAVLNEMADWIPKWEIVCVDDGSTDRTRAILDKLADRIPELRVIHQRNEGIFGAVSRAHRESRGSYIYSTASDGQWPAENLKAMFRSLLDGADLVVGVRTNRRQVYSPARRLVSFAFNLLPPILFGVAVKDAGSVKLGNRDVFEFRPVSRSPFFEAERIIWARRAGLRVEFEPIRFLARTGGREKGASFKNVARSVRDLLACFPAYRLGWLELCRSKPSLTPETPAHRRLLSPERPPQSRNPGHLW